jgi:hypothetical protein
MCVLLHKKIDTLLELKRALRLAELLNIPPKEMGTAKVKLHDRARSVFNPRPWELMTFSVRVGDGPWEDFPLANVHQDLWPEETRAAYDKWQRSRLGAAPNKQGE